MELELNAEMIKKALECCINGDDCTLCPLCDEQSCPCVLNENALALITSQEQRIKELTEENERLNASYTEFERKCASLNDENKRLRENNIFLNNTIGKNAQQALEVTLEEIEKAKADALGEMQDQLKMEFDRFGRKDGFITKETIYWFIDQIAKEMLEGANEN